MKKLLIVLLLAFGIIGVSLTGAIVIDNLAYTYTQDFNTLPTGETGSALTWTNDSTIAGWYQDYQGTTRNEYSFQVVPGETPGTVASGGVVSNTSARFMNLGHANSTDRSVGMYRPFSTYGAVGVAFQNSTGSTIPGFSLGYTGEQWRRFRAVETSLYVEYQVVASVDSLDIDSAPSGWTRVSALQFNSPIFDGNTSDLDGKYQANRTVIAPVTVSASLNDGEYLVIRWYQDRTASDGVTATDARHALAVDDVSFAVVPESSTYALVGGFAALGLALLRRRMKSMQD